MVDLVIATVLITFALTPPPRHTHRTEEHTMIYGPEIVALRGNLETVRERAIDLMADRDYMEAAAVLLGALAQVQFTLGRFNDTCTGCERQLPNGGGHVDPFGDSWHELCWHMELRRVTPDGLFDGPEVTA